MNTEERVKQIIAVQLGVDETEVTPGAKLMDDLGADSLDIVELTMQVEEEWDIVLSDDDVEKLVGAGTVKDVFDYVAAKVK